MVPFAGAHSGCGILFSETLVVAVPRRAQYKIRPSCRPPWFLSTRASHFKCRRRNSHITFPRIFRPCHASPLPFGQLSMSTDADAPESRREESPPPYSSSTDGSDDVLEPTILVLCGQSVHAMSAGTAPLYQLDRGVAVLSRMTRKVEFSRVERAVKTNADGEPSVKPYVRHIYDLRYLKYAGPGSLEAMPSSSPQSSVTAVSRRTIGSAGLKKSRFQSQWKALPITTASKTSNYGQPTFTKDGKALFQIRKKNDRYEWTDGDDNSIAVEDEGEDQHRLIISASLQRKNMDLLVALWCCRLWQYSAEHKEHIPTGIEGG